MSKSRNSRTRRHVVRHHLVSPKQHQQYNLPAVNQPPGLMYHHQQQQQQQQPIVMAPPPPQQILVPQIIAQPQEKREKMYNKEGNVYLSRVMRKPEQLISAFVFATKIVHTLYFLNPKVQSLALFCGCTATFVSNLVKKDPNTGFLMTWLKYSTWS